MQSGPIEVQSLSALEPNLKDDVFLAAASWEERCLGLAHRMQGYRARLGLLTVYDGDSPRRFKHLQELRDHLKPCCDVLDELPALHTDPLENVQNSILRLRSYFSGETALRLSIDISTYTRRHLLQLLHGLDIAGFLGHCRFFYSEQEDYHTQDNEPLVKGIGRIEAVRTFGGSNRPSRDSLLIILLGFEGKRAQAVWERLEPNVTVAVIPDPTLRPDWKGRAEEQNRYLLSCLPKDNIVYSPATSPVETYLMLTALTVVDRYSPEKYNYFISPVGTKAQVLGLYRFWRKNPYLATVVYAEPGRYRQEQADFKEKRVWLLDATDQWEQIPALGDQPSWCEV